MSTWRQEAGERAREGVSERAGRMPALLPGDAASRTREWSAKCTAEGEGGWTRGGATGQ